MSDPIIRIYNEELDAYAKVSQKAFDISYSHRGWVEALSEREEARLASLAAREDEVEDDFADEDDLVDDDEDAADEEASPVEAGESTTVEVVDDEDAS